jgi:hypothetical protein
MQIFLKNKREGFHKVPGINVFGINWVVESADKRALLKLRPWYEKLRMVENEKVRISTALNGSAAYMGRINPYPGDVDFTEIVLVKASSLHEAADIFTDRLQQNIEKALSHTHVLFLELKIGADPETGKGFKWTLVEVRDGVKELGSQENGNWRKLKLSEAVLQRQMMKLDLIAQVEGKWKEVTKVFRFAYQPDISRDIHDIILMTPENLGETIYQELYFSRKEAKLSALLSEVSDRGGFSHPRVMEKYRALMDVEIAHYSAMGMADKVSHLKLLKRWFNKLRMDRDYSSIDKLTEIFRSKVNAVNELKEMMGLLVLAIDKNLLTPREIIAQLNRIDDGLEVHGNQLPTEHTLACKRELRFLRSQIEQSEYVSATKRLVSLESLLERWVEERAKSYLLNEILHPFAERLGIHIHDDTSFERKDLFKGVTKGDKTHYLVNRYLRVDSRVVQKRFNKGDTIIQLGDEAHSCYVILDGVAAVIDPLASHHIRDVGPMTFIGEIALIHDDKRRTAQIVAETDVEALEIPLVVFQELMQDKSFRLFIEFLSTDRLMEDGSRGRKKLAF